jgi:outer membrane protein
VYDPGVLLLRQGPASRSLFQTCSRRSVGQQKIARVAVAAEIISVRDQPSSGRKSGTGSIRQISPEPKSSDARHDTRLSITLALRRISTCGDIRADRRRPSFGFTTTFVECTGFDAASKIKQAPPPMQLKKFICALVGCLALGLQAQTPSGSPTNLTVRVLSLDESIRLALEHNFDIKIQRYNPQIARFTLDSDLGAYDPVFDITASHSESSRNSTGRIDPDTGQRFQDISSETDRISPGVRGLLPTGLQYRIAGDLEHVAGSSLGFPFENYSIAADIRLQQPLLRNFLIDPTRAQIQIDRRNLKISELGFSLLVMDVITRVQIAYYDLIFALENVKVQEKALELNDRLLKENKKKVEVGVLAPLDEKQAEAEVAVTRADLIAARRDVDLRENLLKNLLSDDYRKIHDVQLLPSEALVANPEVFNLAASWIKGISGRPDYQERMLELEKLEIVKKLRRNQLLPSLDITGGYGRTGFGSSLSSRGFSDSVDDIREERNPRHSVGIILSVPLTFRTERNNYRIASAEKDQAALRLKKLEQEIMISIDDAIKLAQSNFDRVGATRQARLFAEAAMDAEQKKLESGKSTSFVVLELQRDLTRARSEEIRALAEYNKALANVALAEGSTLTRNNLSISVK